MERLSTFLRDTFKKPGCRPGTTVAVRLIFPQCLILETKNLPDCLSIMNWGCSLDGVEPVVVKIELKKIYKSPTRYAQPDRSQDKCLLRCGDCERTRHSAESRLSL